MKNNVLKVIRNEDDGIQVDGNSPKKRFQSFRFLIFIILSLIMFSGIFFIKDKVDEYKSMEENLNFQKEKITEDRILMEKTLKKEMENIEALKYEYNQKNLELTEKLEELKVKEEKVNQELQRVLELKDILKDQLVMLYDMNIDKVYTVDEDDKEGMKNSSTSPIDDSNQEAISQSMLFGEDNNDDLMVTPKDKILGIADADWFIRFDSLGEFVY